MNRFWSKIKFAAYRQKWIMLVALVPVIATSGIVWRKESQASRSIIR
jgi:hypothetical protein